VKVVKNLIIVAMCLFFGVYSCKIKRKTENSKTQKELVISMRKTACYGSCPVYTLKLFSNKEIYFIGESYTEKIGKYYNSLTENEYNLLIQAFLAADFFNFKNEYTGNITDMPTTYITFNYNGQTKTIKDYYSAPAKLKQLEKLFDSFREKENWILQDSLN